MSLLAIVQGNAAELIAGLAVIISVFANWEARRANKRADRLDQEMENASKAARKTEMLVEIERKNAAIAKLTLVLARKALLFQRHPNLATRQGAEQERLSKNLSVMQELRSGEEEQRKNAEEAGGGADIHLYQESLANVRRLRVRLEADFENEVAVYKELARECGERDA